MPLEGRALQPGAWFAPRLAVFGVSVLGAGTEAEVTNLDLRAGASGPLLRNGDFSRQLTRWLPSAQNHFIPWHIDNLYLELLVERGMPGLLGFAALAAWMLNRLTAAPGSVPALAPILAASMSGALLIGLLSSVMDAPRTAFLLYFLMGFSVLLCTSCWAGEEPASELDNPATRP